MTLRGETEIVTSGGRDFGRACAMRLAEDGAAGAINYHSSSDGADSAVKEIEPMGGTAFAMQGDLANAADVEALVPRTVSELGEPDIRVNAICPGVMDTDFHNIFTKPEVRNMVAGNMPLRREGTPMDVANLMAYMAGDGAAFMTGNNMDFNGGTLFS